MLRQQLASQRSRRSFNERLRSSASLPASRARYDDERRSRSVARGASMPAWRAPDRREEQMHQPVCMRVSCDSRAVGPRCIEGLPYLPGTTGWKGFEMSQGQYMQDEYNIEYGYDQAPQRQSTMRKQASLARGQSNIQQEDLEESRLRPGVSSLGPKTQSLAPFQVSLSFILIFQS